MKHRKSNRNHRAQNEIQDTQTARNILLIRPRSFQFNAETAASNEFQSKTEADESVIQQTAIAEFERFADSLRLKGINVLIFDDTEKPEKPDAVFPNNWVSFHADGTLILYPMCAASRRSERRTDILAKLAQDFWIEKFIDLSGFEDENRFLEGTGSIVFDHVNKIAYACLSPRTDEELFIKISRHLAYEPLSFRAADANGKEIYHTNVMMCIGVGFAVICLESIENAEEKAKVIESLKQGNLEIIDISFAQMNRFAGNMLAIENDKGEKILVLSQSAFDSLSEEQTTTLEKYSELLPLTIPTIEKIGGGSARCMMAEVFLPEIEQK